MFLSGKAWRGRSYNLGKMNLRELIVAYFTYPAIQVYLFLCAVGLIATSKLGGSLLGLGASALLTVLVYPLVWYVLHRWVLHSRYLYKIPVTASLWKRIHFDHHQDPYKLEVLFGSLWNTLPTIVIITGSIGYLLAGWGGAAMAISTGLAWTCVYEFCHCIQHLNYKPQYEFLRRMKQLHMAHHFHNEKGNFGITNFAWDRLFGSFYQSAKDVPRSSTVMNLGYDLEEANRYPWVARLSAEAPRDRVRYREISSNSDKSEELADRAA